MLEIMFYDGWRWGLALQRCLLRSSGMLYRARVAGVTCEGRGYLFSPLCYLGARARAGVRFPPSLLVAESVSRLAGTHRSAGGYRKSTYLYAGQDSGDRVEGTTPPLPCWGWTYQSGTHTHSRKGVFGSGAGVGAGARSARCARDGG